MLVWHIDYNENIWRYNTVNDRKDHQYVDLIEADNLQSSDNVEGDPFPGIANITSFTDDTEPAMRSWSGQGCGMPLTDIYESNGYIYLKANGGKSAIEPVTALDAAEIGVDQFTARWEASADPAAQYQLSVYTSTATESGQTYVQAVDGYDALNVGSEVTSYAVTGLEPGGEYRYSIRVLDTETNLLSVPSNEILVQLLAPSFDYLSPLASEASEITSEGFTAAWTPLDGAESYLVTVISKTMGEPESTDCGFSGGLSDLPEGWSTNSKLTYAAEDYCGEETPSLRFNSENQYLEMTVGEGYVRGLSFWCRTVGALGDASLDIMARVAGQWQHALTLSLASTQDDPVFEIPEEEMPYGADALRIVFRPEGKGSVAIDDVVLLWGGESVITDLPDHTELPAGAATQLAITGLAPSATYFYTVVGINAEGIKSRPSNEVRVVTLADAGIADAVISSIISSYDKAEGHLIISGLMPHEDVGLFNSAAGSIRVLHADADGNIDTHLNLCQGVYLLRSASGYTIKLMN